MSDSNSRKLSPRRQRTRTARFREIREHAMRLIRSSGVDGLTIQGLADELDWAAGTLYRYYPSKDALLEDLQIEISRAVDAMIHEQRAAFIAWAPSEAQHELALVMVAGLAYVDFAVQQPAQFRLLCLSIGDPQPVLDDDEVARLTTEALLKPVGAVARLLNAAAEHGALSTGAPMPRALLFWLSLHAVVMTRKLARLTTEFDPDGMVRSCITTLLSGWGAASDELDGALEVVAEWRRSR